MNTGLLCRKTTDGIQIVYDRSSVDALMLYAQDQQEPLSFDFKVYSEDPDFKSYTRPGIADTDTMLYFDNRSTGRAGRYNLSVAKYVSDKDLKKTDADEFNDILSSKDRLLRPEFVVRIFASSKKGLLLQQWLESESTVYSIRFDSRQSYWKYYLLGRLVSDKNVKPAFRVVDPENKIEFEATGEELLSNQRVAYTFRSKQLIPFNDYYPYRFQLKRKIQGDDVTVINRLPVASARQLGIDQVADQATVVAEIYINS